MLSQHFFGVRKPLRSLFISSVLYTRTTRLILLRGLAAFRWDPSTLSAVSFFFKCKFEVEIVMFKRNESEKGAQWRLNLMSELMCKYRFFVPVLMSNLALSNYYMFECRLCVSSLKTHVCIRSKCLRVSVVTQGKVLFLRFQLCWDIGSLRVLIW